MKPIVVAAVALLSLPAQADQAQVNDYCDMYHRIHLHSNTINTLESIGEPYNEHVTIQKYDHAQRYNIVLDKEKFIELYLTFGSDGKLQNKSIAGIFCPKTS